MCQVLCCQRCPPNWIWIWCCRSPPLWRRDRDGFQSRNRCCDILCVHLVRVCDRLRRWSHPDDEECDLSSPDRAPCVDKCCGASTECCDYPEPAGVLIWCDCLAPVQCHGNCNGREVQTYCFRQ